MTSSLSPLVWKKTIASPSKLNNYLRAKTLYILGWVPKIDINVELLFTANILLIRSTILWTEMTNMPFSKTIYPTKTILVPPPSPPTIDTATSTLAPPIKPQLNPTIFCHQSINVTTLTKIHRRTTLSLKVCFFYIKKETLRFVTYMLYV